MRYKGFFLILFVIPIILSTNKIFAGRCSGSSSCHACTTCSSCKYCNSGGSCRVCSGGGGLGKLILYGGGALIIYSLFDKKSQK